ncbi:hypothetical protein Dda_1689 [Drechslerella dactyloides]|uniref:gamma-glutamylcyclotransferase n=1 Tax=Drechslerella dactyloides TaxID=74499 RepID=A0AAD6J256_DREDA|nr:hypothetical protein Dda_1689 [Drechslerella dactyloides]
MATGLPDAVLSPSFPPSTRFRLIRPPPPAPPPPAPAHNQTLTDALERFSQEGPTVLYFAYGSNLSFAKMRRECPTARFCTRAYILGHRWFISSRGFANIVASPADLVWGNLYVMERGSDIPTDGQSRTELPDGRFRFNLTYIKQYMDVKVPCNTMCCVRDLRALVYVDLLNRTEGTPGLAYVAQVREGIRDAALKGMPFSYIRRYMLGPLGLDESVLAEVVQIAQAQYTANTSNAAGANNAANANNTAGASDAAGASNTAGTNNTAGTDNTAGGNSTAGGNNTAGGNSTAGGNNTTNGAT